MRDRAVVPLRCRVSKYLIAFFYIQETKAILFPLNSVCYFVELISLVVPIKSNFSKQSRVVIVPNQRWTLQHATVIVSDVFGTLLVTNITNNTFWFLMGVLARLQLTATADYQVIAFIWKRHWLKHWVNGSGLDRSLY